MGTSGSPESRSGLCNAHAPCHGYIGENTGLLHAQKFCSYLPSSPSLPYG